MSTLRIGELEAVNGERVSGELTVPMPWGDTKIPIILLNGSKEGPTVGITAGIHGCEYCSIESVIRLGKDLSPEDLAGALVLIPIVNSDAFYARSIYVNPMDGKNPNRVFPGKAKGTFSDIVAHHLTEEVFSKLDYYMDFHGGDMIEALVPFTSFVAVGDESVDSASEDLARSFGLDIVCTSTTVGSTYSAAAAMGKPAILAEAGGNGLLVEEDVQILLDGTRSALAHLGMLAEGKSDPSRSDLRRMAWLRSEYRGLFYRNVSIGEQMEKGQKVGEVRNAFGEKITDVHSPADGPVLFIVTSLATNPGDPMLAVAELAN